VIVVVDTAQHPARGVVGHPIDANARHHVHLGVLGALGHQAARAGLGIAQRQLHAVADVALDHHLAHCAVDLLDPLLARRRHRLLDTERPVGAVLEPHELAAEPDRLAGLELRYCTGARNDRRSHHGSVSAERTPLRAGENRRELSARGVVGRQERRTWRPHGC
jgi:hypothetical protein